MGLRDMKNESKSHIQHHASFTRAGSLGTKTAVSLPYFVALLRKSGFEIYLLLAKDRRISLPTSIHFSELDDKPWAEEQISTALFIIKAVRVFFKKTFLKKIIVSRENCRLSFSFFFFFFF